MANPNPAAETAPRTTGPLPRRVIKEAFLDHVDESRFSRFVASSNRIDRYGDIIEQEWACGAEQVFGAEELLLSM